MIAQVMADDIPQTRPAYQRLSCGMTLSSRAPNVNFRKMSVWKTI